jgi:ATP-dependent DNA helicase RecG
MITKFSCLDDYFYKEFNAMSLLKALKKLHFPQDDYDIALNNYNLAKQRLAFEEIYLHKHEFLKIVDKYNKKDSYLLNVSKEELENFYNSLPFELTKGQKNAVGSISDSFRSSAHHQRYLFKVMLVVENNCRSYSLFICC